MPKNLGSIDMEFNKMIKNCLLSRIELTFKDNFLKNFVYYY